MTIILAEDSLKTSKNSINTLGSLDFNSEYEIGLREELSFEIEFLEVSWETESELEIKELELFGILFDLQLDSSVITIKEVQGEVFCKFKLLWEGVELWLLLLVVLRRELFSIIGKANQIVRKIKLFNVLKIY